MRGVLVFAFAVLALAVVPGSSNAAASRLSIADVRVVEGNSGTKRAVVSVRRSGSSRRKAGVRYATADGTATAGSDYLRRSGKLTFRRGQNRKAVVISVRGDTLDEPNETFFVKLSRSKGARMGRSRARATIVDDDAPLGLPSGSPSTGGGAFTGGGPPAGGGPPTGGGPGEGTPQTVRFIAVGATGKGNQGQSDVADAMQAKCAASGCDFIHGLGNNIYPSGVSSTSDSLFQTAFETPYQDIDLPFFMLLGNHDYGGDGSGIDFDKGQHQVDYTTSSSSTGKWQMPARFYRHSHEQAEFFVLDTTQQMFNNDADQELAVPGWFAGSTAVWKIALGLHGYRSNGTHGNAGEYDGLPFIPIANGAGVKDFMDDHVCGKADVYFSAHDHSLQWPSTTCDGTELIVSGAGADSTELDGDNPTHFESLELGFVYVTIQDSQLTAEFIGVDGDTLFTRTISK